MFSKPIFEDCLPRWQAHLPPGVSLRLGAVPLASLADPSDLAGRYLGREELNRWQSLRLNKRRAEWLGGRLAAKRAVAALSGRPEEDWPGLVIGQEEDGRPCLYATGANLFVAISHSGPLAAALAASLPCGLDIQQPTGKIHQVKKRFALREEEDILTSSLPSSFSETERLTLLWATKEAIRKLVRVSPLPGLREIRLLAGQGGGAPENPLVFTCAFRREEATCPAPIPVLCFFAHGLAWAMTFLQQEE